MKNYFSISLVISSLITPPESISERIGLAPTSTRLRGTPTKTGVLRRPEFDLHELADFALNLNSRPATG